MSKRHVTKKSVSGEQDNFCDFSEDEFSANQATASLIQGLVESARFDADIALRLTSLFVENNASAAFTQEDLFALYREALAVAAESSPMKQIMEIIGDR